MSNIKYTKLTKELLEEQYIQNKKSTTEIQKLFNCSNPTILRYLKKYSIKIRTISEAKKEQLKNPKNNGRYIDGRSLEINYCIDCGVETSNYQHKRCGSCASKERLKDPRNHPNYIHGKSYEPYTKEFTPELREIIKKRDNYVCQGENCSLTQEEHFIMYGRNIEIHHIDYNKSNCNEDNLITLCKQCNCRANYNRQYWQEYFTEKIIGGK